MEGWAQSGRWLLIVGTGIAVLGGLLLLGSRLFKETKVPWLGHLPGDIHIQTKGLSCYLPLVSSILLSVLLTVILNVIVRLLRHR
jgi:hypothetical protein